MSNPAVAITTPSKHTPATAGDFSDGETAKRFMLAGRAYFTVKSHKTGKHMTFRVNKPGRKADIDVYFVSVREDAGYVYIGLINAKTHNFYSAKYKPGRKIPALGALPVQVFSYVWRGLQVEILPPQTELLHSNRCGRCGRPLTHPDSIKTGIGPECIKHMDNPRIYALRGTPRI